MLNTLILMGSMLLLGPGCASYRELSPSWREHGTSVLGLVAYDVGFSNAAPVRLSPDTAVMVAFAETPHFGLEETDHSDVEPDKRIPPVCASEPPVEELALMRSLAVMQTTALQWYFPRVFLVPEGTTRDQAFSRARQEAIPILFFLMADANQDNILNNNNLFYLPVQQRRLVFWIYDVQTELLLQSGYLAVQGAGMRSQEKSFLRKLAAPMRAVAAQLSAASKW
ncbi:MAG: hypothetical protein P8104_00825 [Gammaproteobacteria bacterium]